MRWSDKQKFNPRPVLCKACSFPWFLIMKTFIHFYTLCTDAFEFFKLIKETTSVCLQISLSVELPSVPSDIITFSLFTTSLPKVESHIFTPFMSLCIYLGRSFSATPKRKRTLSLLLIVYLWKNYMEEENECSKMHGRQEVSQSIVIVILY